MNLLQETIEMLRDNNKTPKDVKWVGGKGVKSTWENFAAVANKEYDDGFGGQEVAQDLLIVGEDWWLERHEYDGSEWWEFKQLPKEPEKQIVLIKVIGGIWDNLEAINNNDL